METNVYKSQNLSKSLSVGFPVSFAVIGLIRLTELI